jgi:hypothetical protein
MLVISLLSLSPSFSLLKVENQVKIFQVLYSFHYKATLSICFLLRILTSTDARTFLADPMLKISVGGMEIAAARGKQITDANEIEDVEKTQD